MSRANAALDLIANLALAGAAAAIVVRPEVVARIASSPLLPKAAALTRGLMPAPAQPRPLARAKQKADELAGLISRYRPQAQRRHQEITRSAGRRLNGSAAMLAFSVLADSAVEHYRGSFQNRAMYTPLVAAALTLGASLFGVTDSRASKHVMRDAIYA
ncbi:MAG: hypothetical protein WBD80_14545, partial [Xanthobacteraceae bacterium]